MQRTLSQVGLGWLIALVLCVWVLSGLIGLPSGVDPFRHVFVVVALVFLVTWGIKKGRKAGGRGTRGE